MSEYRGKTAQQWREAWLLSSTGREAEQEALCHLTKTLARVSLSLRRAGNLGNKAAEWAVEELSKTTQHLWECDAELCEHKMPENIHNEKESTTMIDYTKPVQTRDGREVRILCTDRAHPVYPVVGIVEGEVFTFTASGVYIQGENSEKDLMNVPKEFSYEEWVNVYENGERCFHPSREDADVLANSGRVACVKVRISGREGDGL